MVDEDDENKEDEEEDENNDQSDDNGDKEGDIQPPSNSEVDEEEPNIMASDQDEESFNEDDEVPNGVDTMRDKEVPYEPKDYIIVTRHLVESRGNGELLMVMDYRQSPPCSRPYTRNVEVFKTDINAGKWVPVMANGLTKGEALFLKPTILQDHSWEWKHQGGFHIFCGPQ
ncbi:hypothetical protein ACP4OV_018482 [Aristida adscensionis]